MAKVIMVQGTMSNAGKSLICAGLCRIFAQDGFKVAPFKSQNMALNSYVTEDGLEMGRAQVMQAEAAMIKPEVSMNPILLKPNSDMGSQVIVNGTSIGNMPAREYFAYKKTLIPEIKKAFLELSKRVDIIVMEGAGSPAEINLKGNDIVNMGLAELADSNVLLVGDIDRGGVFAQLLGTLMLLEEDEKNRVKGLIINKFRGDKSLLDSGIDMLEEKGGVKVAGVVPYVKLLLDDEDSLTERFDNCKAGDIDIAIIRYPRISNFTDFNVFEQHESISVRYVGSVKELKNPDVIILPGSKNTMEDLQWLKDEGLAYEITQRAKNTIIFGICGGFQMLGETVADPHCVESSGVKKGLGLLPVSTVLGKEKVRRQKNVKLVGLGGPLSSLNGKTAVGYELHIGVTTGLKMDADGVNVVSAGNVYGTYLHGIFDEKEIAAGLIETVAKEKKLKLDTSGFQSMSEIKDREYERLAQVLRESMDMDMIYGMLKESDLK